MPQHTRDVMTSNPCTIDAERSVAYAAKMMREEDVGLAPIVEGDMLIGMLTDRDIATRVAAQGRNPDQVKVREVASTQLVTVGPQQDLDEVLRKMARHKVRRLPVVDEHGKLIGVVAQADIAREGDRPMTGQLVEEISESGGQMSSFEERQYPTPPLVESQLEGVLAPQVPQLAEEQPEEQSISKVQSSSRGRRKRAASSRKRKTTARKTTARKSAGTRKRKTAARKSTGARKRKTAARKSTGTRARKTASRKRSTASRKRKTTARKSTATRKRKTTARKSASARKRKTTARKSAGARKKRTTASRKRSTGAKKRTTARRTTTRRKTAARKTSARKTRARKTRARKTSARKTSSRRRATRRK